MEKPAGASSGSKKAPRGLTEFELDKARSWLVDIDYGEKCDAEDDKEEEK